jgi:adenine-specific DNA-methyltransferase
VTVGDDIFVLRGKQKGKSYIGYSAAADAEVEVEASLVKPLVKGEHIRRYGTLTSDIVILYPQYLDKRGKTVPYTEAEMKASFPLAYAYFKPFKKQLIEKKIKYKTNPDYWFSLHRSRDKQLFDGRKIITPQLQNMPHFTLDDQGWYPDAGGYSLVGCASRREEEFLLGVLNSKVLWYFIKNISNGYNNNYYYFKTKYLEPFTLPACSKKDEETIAELVSRVLECAVSPERERESWKLQATIDKHVYRLYGLTADEIETIEKAAAW